MDGLFHGQSHSKMDDDWGYPYDLGNLHIVREVWEVASRLQKLQHWKFLRFFPCGTASRTLGTVSTQQRGLAPPSRRSQRLRVPRGFRRSQPIGSNGFGGHTTIEGCWARLKPYSLSSVEDWNIEG